MEIFLYIKIGLEIKNYLFIIIMKERSFSKKKLIKDFLVFDWKKYIATYKDLDYINTKEEAWYHWINYGKHENRVINNLEENLENNKEYKNFDWKTYVEKYEDLSHIDSKNDAWKHWLNHGKSENRVIVNLENDEEYANFDWKTYIGNYEDLTHIVSKDEAWKHWINHGKSENRVINSLSSLYILDTNEEFEKFKNFDWKSYISNYYDLANIDSKEEAWKHWKINGKNENRICENIYLFDDYKTFEWKKYIGNYEDLTYIDSKEEAWKHFILYGFNEGRKLNDIKEIEINEYKKIIEDEEDNNEEYDFSDNKVYFKKKYTNCGKHFFGWKSSVNYLLEHYSFSNSNFNKKYYFDEWIEKLLIWGNKIQNKKCLDMIHEQNLQLITFMHCPPFENYDFKLMNKDLILNDVSFFNKNIIDLINNSKLFYSLTYLYVLSIDHKNYIINTYPEFKNKVVSVYHPIDIDNHSKNDLFDINKFNKNKTFYHIGWWLRNFTSFFNLDLPKYYNKSILVKQEFKQQFYEKFSNIDNNIKIIHELKDSEYKKIFSSSCIFCDLADSVANNVVLECIKYNTPIVVKRIPSVEEYLGVDYPLFFNDISELKEFTDEEKLNKKIIKAHKYLLQMNKKPFMIDTFSNKISYDITKLQINNDNYKLTWLYYLNNEDDDIEKYISTFNNQISSESIKLIIVNSLVSKLEILEKYKSDNINIINIDSNLDKNEIYDIFIKNSTTEYLTLKKYNDICDDNYSDICINYLENNPTFDVIIFKNNQTNKSNKNIEKVVSSTNIFELVHDNSSESSNFSEILSDFSEKNNESESKKNPIFDIDNKLENENIELENENIELEKDNFELENENIELEKESVSEDTELEKKIEVENNTIHSETLLTYSQISSYNFDDKNVNILWRKSIHTFINNFDENYWINCYKNNLNIFEIK